MVFGIAESLKIALLKAPKKRLFAWHETKYNPFWCGYFMIYLQPDQYAIAAWYVVNIKRQKILVDDNGRWNELSDNTLIHSSMIMKFYFKTIEDASVFKLMWIQ